MSKTNIMNNEIELEAPVEEAADTAKDSIQKLSSKLENCVESTTGYAQHAVEATKEAAHRASDTAREVYHSASLRAGETYQSSKDYARQNPATVVLGALAVGAALGYLFVKATRKPSFGERFADQPLGSVREAIAAALAPVSSNVHDGYDSARDGMGRVLDRARHFSPSHSADSLSHRLGRVGSNLKFW